MNLQSIILLIIILAAFGVALYFVIKRNGTKTCNQGKCGCDGDCANCSYSHR